MMATLTRWRGYLPTQARLLQLLPMLVIALFGFIFALLTAVVVMPAVLVRSERLAQLPGANQALQVAQAAQAAAPQQLQVQIDQAKGRLQKAAAYFLSETLAADALNGLYQAARASGVTIVALENQTPESQTPLPTGEGAPTAAPPYTMRTFGLRATGEMDQLINFVASIRESKRSGFVITNLRIGLAGTAVAASTAANARATTKNSTTTAATSNVAAGPLQTATMNINLYTSEYAQGGAITVTGTLTTPAATGLATPVATMTIASPAGSELLFPLPTFTPGAPLTPTLAVVLLPLATPIPTLPGGPTLTPTALPTTIPLPTPTVIPTLPPTASATPIVLPSPTPTSLTATPVTPTTPVPTVTAGVTTTPNGSPTAVPPVPAGCTNLLVNSDFEGAGGWSLGENALLPQLTTNQAYNGGRAMQLGNPPGVYNGQIAGYSSIQQAVTIPADATNAILRWWHWDGSEEASYGAPSSEADRQDVVLLHPTGDVLALLQRVRRNEGTWLPSAIDLSAFRGQSIILYFNVYNDGLGGRSWSFLDEVRLETCTGVATPLPPTATSVPTAIAPPIPTLPPTATSVPTDTPGATPLPTLMPVITPAVFDCSGNLYNCSDFSTQSEAQAVYNYCVDEGLGDVHLLDQDADQVACESLLTTLDGIEPVD